MMRLRYSKYRLNSIIQFALVFLLSTGPLLIHSLFPGGSGTREDPWHIETPEDLQNINQHLDGHYIQIKDIDLGVSPWNDKSRRRLSFDWGNGWEPIGTEDSSGFSGTYNGNGHLIRGLTTWQGRSHQELFSVLTGQRRSHQGLFSVLTGGAEIYDLGLVDVNIKGGKYVGAFAGEMLNNSSIKRCFVTGDIDGTMIVGGITGGTKYSEGEKAIISDCYSTARITSHYKEVSLIFVGGICGILARDSEILRSYATGLIETRYTTNSTGAIAGVGRDCQHISWNIETTGQTRATGRDDSFPGSTTKEMMKEGTFTGFDFHNVWRIDEGESFPYLQWEGDKRSSHNLPSLMPPKSISHTPSNGKIDLKWETPYIGKPDGYNIYRNDERINEQLITGREYSDFNLNNWTTYRYRLAAIYGDTESTPSAYIYAAPVDFSGGSGSYKDPYLIETAEQLHGVRVYPEAHYRLIKDIDLSIAPYNTGWEPIGTAQNRFSGSFDGNFHTINNLKLSRLSQSQGLFGLVRNAVVRRVVLKNANTRGLNSVGGIIAISQNSLISECSFEGIVTVNNLFGGIIGNSSSDQIEKCFSTGVIRIERIGSGVIRSTVGGITGSSIRSSITDSYSTFSIAGESNIIGGLSGSMRSGTIVNSYFNGVISEDLTEKTAAIVGVVYDSLTVKGLFWNEGVAGKSVPAFGGFAISRQMSDSLIDLASIEKMAMKEVRELSEAGLKNKRTYSGAGWDMVNVWSIADGKTLPVLKYQKAKDDNELLVPVNLTTTLLKTGTDNTPLCPYTKIRIGWNSSANPTYYKVYRNDIFVAKVSHPELTYLDDYRTGNISYYVTAVYQDQGIETETSPSVSAKLFLHPQFAGGDGSKEYPFQVDSPKALAFINNNLNAHYIQTKDIDLKKVSLADERGWETIGTSRNRAFQGTYNGNGFKISGMIIRKRSGGLFGNVANAEISNVNIIDVDMQEVVGGAIAGVVNNTTISNCFASGQISGYSTIGGLVGKMENGSIIKNSSSICDVSAANYDIGGLVGEVSESSVINSYSRGSVFAGTRRGGGLIGISRRSVVTDSYSTGSVRTKSDEAGGLIGHSWHNTVKRCYSTGNVRGANKTGGLIGESSGSTIENCYSLSPVEGEDNTGGLIGYNYYSNISRSYSRGMVYGQNRVGGLVGSIKKVEISESFSTSDVKGIRRVGGLIGSNEESEIINTYSTGSVTGIGLVGGLMGTSYKSTTTYSFSTGDTIGIEFEAEGLVSNHNRNTSYSHWNVNLSAPDPNRERFLRLLQQNRNYDGDLSQVRTPNGLTTEEMLQTVYFWNWDIEDNSTGKTWSIINGKSYPALSWQVENIGYFSPGPHNLTAQSVPGYIDLEWSVSSDTIIGYNLFRNGERLNKKPLTRNSYRDTKLVDWQKYHYQVTAVLKPGIKNRESLPSNPVEIYAIAFSSGDGTELNPFLINNADQLTKIICYPKGYYKQTADIDLNVPPYNENQGWKPVGTHLLESFQGSYDGNGFSISGLTINNLNADDQGLFGVLVDADITNVHLKNVRIIAADNVGALAGQAIRSSISHSSAQFEIMGNTSVGGLIGFCSRESGITDSFAEGRIRAVGQNVGGLLGQANNLTIERCYFKGVVEGTSSYIGGIAGRCNDIFIKDCFTMGRISGTLERPGSSVAGISSGRNTIVNCYSVVSMKAQHSIFAIASSTGSEDHDRNNYWNADIAGSIAEGRGSGRTTEQMTYPYSEDTYLGWDFDNIWIHDVDHQTNDGYPFLRSLLK